jgi:hypothetical protein
MKAIIRGIGAGMHAPASRLSAPGEYFMSRGLTLLLCTFTLVVGCSNDPDRSSRSTATSPTATSAPAPGSLVGSTSVAPGGVSGKFDVSFPPRNDSFDFRNQLETKYLTGLGRAAAATFVDREGEVVWTQEYMRYRTNGCDHATAVLRVMTQIDGQPAGGLCGTAADGLITFPPRTDSFDFRRQLETRYQQFGRGASSSSVDAEGGVIWTQEYLRYRVNACDHPTSVQKVFSQIDGGGVAATCFVPPCVFTISPTTQSGVPSGGATYTATVTNTQGSNCSYTAESLASWVTIGSGAAGSAATNTVTYTVGPNFGGARSTFIRIRFANSSTLLEITQDAGTSIAFTLTDPNASSNATTNCSIRTTATPCRLAVTSGVFSSSATFTWHVEYEQGGGIGSHDSTSTNSNFTFNQSCGGPNATSTGYSTNLRVTLTVVDGNSTVVVQSGAGGQPTLNIVFFTCSA